MTGGEQRRGSRVLGFLAALLLSLVLLPLIYYIAGVDLERLRVEWYGETRPFIPNATTEAEHQANRRVEFHIEDWGGGALNVETLPPEPLDPVGRTPEDPLDY